MVYNYILLFMGLIILISITVVYSTNDNLSNDLKVSKISAPKYMVTISLLNGGLGNQLFKIATAYAYAKSTDKELVFDVAESTFPYSPENIKYFDSFYGWTKNIDISKYEWEIYKEKEGYYNDIPILHKNVKLEGYFQSTQYFHQYKTEILKLFYDYLFTYVPLNLTLLQDTNINTVCIHFRYIDYLNNPQFDILQPDYYTKAITYIQQKIINPVFVVFSDQMSHCKQQLSHLNCIFVEQGSEIDQQNWMSLCKHHIIPNSTFSWWAAYQNDTGIVIIPRVWCDVKFGTVWEGLKMEKWIIF